MAQTTANVAAASPVATGGMLVAPLGTALPTNATVALDAAFIPLGYVSEDGVGDSSDAASTEDVFAWGGDNVASLSTTGSVKRYVAKLIELFNEDVANFLYGEANVTFTAAAGVDGSKLAILDKAEEIDACVVVFDMKYKGKRKRIVIANAQPQVTAEDAHVHTAISGTEVTVTCLKDDAGVRQYIYMQNDDIADES
jgi:hypothetical protein